MISPRMVRRYRDPVLVTLAWVALFFVAQLTSRTPQLLAGSVMVCVVLGAVHHLAAIREAAREIERETASEIALSVRVPKHISEEERLRMEALKAHIAVTIRGCGAHLREVRRG